MSKILRTLKHELLEAVPPAIFFLIAFYLLSLTHSLMLRSYGIDASTFVAATVGALIVAKVVLIADMLPLINRFPEKPLIYNVVWKTLLYLMASLLVRYVEHLIHFLREGGGFEVANRRLLDEVVWPHFWAIQLWLLVLFLVYCSLRELSRVLGRDAVTRIFFSRPEQVRAAIDGSK